MIVLNSDKEIIRVESWVDITGRPGFTGNLDPSEHKLDAIIGRYAFKDYVPCGLSNCHTPHGRGYIVVTKDGQETNIGKDCGKAYFGVDFETLSNKFDRDMSEKENREKLWNFYFRIEEVKEQVTAMRGGERGADWVYKQLTNLRSTHNVPFKVTRLLERMAKSRDTRVVQEREATEEEVSRLETAQGRRIQRPHVVTILLGELAGLDALYPENNLKSILIEDISVHIKELTEIDIDSLTYEQLRKWSRWLGALDATFEKAAQSVRSGQTLLVQENLARLAVAADLNTDETGSFQSFISHFPKQ